MSIILGLDGRPLQASDRRALQTEIADAQLTGLRNIWSHVSMASGLDPVRLAGVLERAAQGDHHDFLTLAEEIEERDLHYASVLGTRKRAISGLDITVEAFSDDAQDQRLADEIRTLVQAPDFGDMLDDLLDALGKGYSAVEIIWASSSKQWWPERFEWRDPRFFLLDPVAGQDLRLITEQSPFGEPLPAWKFIQHRPRLKSGLPIRGGLARLASVAYMCKSFALSDWMTFAEIFGMPIRVGKYGPNATAAEKDTLRAAVGNIGSDAAAIIPDSMKIEFEKAAGTAGGEALYERLCEWLDKQVSKGVLGQTMTTDDGSSMAQAKVHNEVRDDILNSDVRQLENTLGRDLVRPYIDFNHGPQRGYPRICLPVPEPEDLKLLAEALEKLVPLGLKVGMSSVRDKFGLPDPDKDEELLQAPQPAGATAPEPVADPAMNRELALNAQQREADELEQLIDDELADWQPQMQPLIDPLQQLLDESQDEDEFRARLPELLGQMDSSELVNRLALGMFKARGLGDGR